MLHEQWLTKDDVARALRVSRRTVERMAADGRLPPPVRFGRSLVRWSGAGLSAFCRERLKTAHALGR